MRFHILLSLILIFNPTVTTQKSAAAKPDFSGIWNARIIKSGREPIYILTISYSEPKLEIVRMRWARQAEIVLGRIGITRSSERFVYYTDGRGEIQTVPTISGEPMKSKTERNGDKFVITSKDSAGKVNNNDTTTLEVSSDGKTLTETVTLSSEVGNTHRIVHLYERTAGNNTADINGEWQQRIMNPIISLTIEHRDPEIKVTRREVSEAQDETEVFVYYTDGRGETNVKAGRRVKSVTKWKKQTLVFSLSSKSKSGRDTFELKETIKWQIAKDGENLVEASELKMSASAGVVFPPGPKTLVYARSSEPLPE